MNGVLDATLYIIDNENGFYLCTKDTNLKLQLNDAQKYQTYQLIKRLKSNRFELDGTLFEGTSFEAKLIDILVRKKIIKSITTETGIEGFPIRHLYGPVGLLELVKQEAQLSGKVHTASNGSFLEVSGRMTDQDVYMTLTEGAIYLSAKRLSEEPVQEVNANYLKYAVFVILEKLDMNLLKRVENEIVHIDLELYTNSMRSIVLEPIDYTNFVDSYYAEHTLSGNRLSFDHNKYFPLVALEWTTKNHRKYFALGFTEDDAVNNLLHIQSEQEFTFQKRAIEKETQLSNAIFFGKYIKLFFNEELIVQEGEDEIKFSLNSYELKLHKNSELNEYSYFISVYLNNLVKVSDVYADAIVVK